MQPQDVKTAADAMKIVEDRGITHIKVGLFDADGVLRGKYISKLKFASALESGFGFLCLQIGASRFLHSGIGVQLGADLHE